MKKVFILHAWYNNPQSHWYPWLKEELERKEYKVYTPKLPTMDTNLPNMELQLETIKNTADIDQNTIIIGHSLSCLLAMRLGEGKKYRKMVLVAGWDFDDLTPEHKLFWQNKINHEGIRKNVKEIFVFHSDNDPYITAFQAEEMSKRLGGKFILVKGAGHFTKKDGVTKIPQVLKLL